MALSGEIIDTIQMALASFLEDFANGMTLGDRKHCCVAAARVAQLGMSVFEIFDSGSEAMCLTADDRAACHAAAVVVRDYMEKNLETWYENSKTVAERAKLLIN